jgi:micrococcal nuclease
MSDDQVMITIFFGSYVKYLLLFILPLSLLADMGTLRKVVDGDTLHFNNAKCRIAYIDTPESKRNKKAKRDAKQCENLTLDTMVKIGKASSAHANTLVQVGKLYKYDVIGTDRYKRSICVVYTPGGIFNELMVKNGYAMPYQRYVPNNLVKKYNGLVREAKRLNRGLWRKYDLHCIGK